MAVQFEVVCGPKFMTLWDDLGDPLWLATHLIDCLYQGRVANPRPVAKIKTGRVSQPITDAADATGRDRSWNATRPRFHSGDKPFVTTDNVIITDNVITPDSVIRLSPIV